MATAANASPSDPFRHIEGATPLSASHLITKPQSDAQVTSGSSLCGEGVCPLPNNLSKRRAPSMAVHGDDNNNNSVCLNDRFSSSSLSPTTLTQTSSDSADLDSASSITTIDLADHEHAEFATLPDERKEIKDIKHPLRTNMSTTLIQHVPQPSAAPRSSGRARKPTAKAQAMFDLTPDPDDSTTHFTEDNESTESIAGGSHAPLRSQTGSPISASSQEQTFSPASSMLTDPQIDIRNNDHDTAILETIEEPVKRTSARERKPTVKAWSVSVAPRRRRRRSESDADATNIPQKRSLSPTQASPRSKILKLSYNAAKIPSKLRFSMSTHGSEATHQSPVPSQTAHLMAQPNLAEANEPAIGKRQRLKRKRTKILTAPLIDLTKNEKSTGTSSSKPVCALQAEPASSEVSKKCDLSCLSPPSKLLAFAQIAAESSDSDDEACDGIFQRWLSIAQERFCRCFQPAVARVSRASSAELAEALKPNTVFQAPALDNFYLTGTTEDGSFKNGETTVTLGSELQSRMPTFLGTFTSTDRRRKLGVKPRQTVETPTDRRPLHWQHESSETPKMSSMPSVYVPEARFIAPHKRRDGDQVSGKPRSRAENRHDEKLFHIQQDALTEGLSIRTDMTYDEVQRLIEESLKYNHLPLSHSHGQSRENAPQLQPDKLSNQITRGRLIHTPPFPRKASSVAKSEPQQNLSTDSWEVLPQAERAWKRPRTDSPLYASPLTHSHAAEGRARHVGETRGWGSIVALDRSNGIMRRLSTSSMPPPPRPGGDSITVRQK